MINLDDITNEYNEDHNKKWPYIPDHPYRMLIVGGSGSGKTYTLLNLIREQDSDNLIDKIYLYAKDLNEPKYQSFIKKREDPEVKYLNGSKAIIEYSQYLDDVYDVINDYNPKKRKLLIVFDDMIADTNTNKKFKAIIKELFTRCKKLNASLAFMTISFSCSKSVRLNKFYKLPNNEYS